jgi:Demethylmenaquinone methyltransferase
VNDFPQPLPAADLARARALATTLLSDVAAGDVAMRHDVSPVRSDMRMAGAAVTVDLPPGDNTALHAALYQRGTGYVLVADGHDHRDHAYAGEIMVRAARALAWEGLVVAGLLRDRAALEEIGLPVFGQGFHPVGPRKAEPGRINVPITCAGVPVHPGDLVVGDADGVVVIPRAEVPAVLTAAEEKRDREAARLATIAGFDPERDDPAVLRPVWLRAAG